MTSPPAADINFQVIWREKKKVRYILRESRKLQAQLPMLGEVLVMEVYTRS
jgi:hypothetical protein